MRQTPINIDNKLTTKVNTAALTFQYQDAPLVVSNTGHTVELEYPAGSTIRLGQFASSGTVNWSQATDEFQLAQFHFHAPSEHTIDGKRADMEVHLVHKNLLGDIAVVGVLMNISSDTSLLVDSIMNIAPLAPGDKGVEGVSFNARQLIPENRSYYMYSGSLTTPPCTEGVRWFVMRNPITVSPFAVGRCTRSSLCSLVTEVFRTTTGPSYPRTRERWSSTGSSPPPRCAARMRRASSDPRMLG